MSSYIESFLNNNPGIANVIAMMQGMNIHQLSNPAKETDLQELNGVPWGNPPLEDSDSKNQKTFGTPEIQDAANKISQPPTNSNPFEQPDSTLGMFRDYFKNPPKTQPQTGTQIADENFNQAVINEQNRAMIQQLGMFKNIYDSAPEGIQGDFLRKYSSGQADAIRQTAQQLGIDLGAWGDGGSGISTQDSNVAIMRDQYEQAKAAQEKFQSVQDDLRNKYGMSSQEYYDERYNYYRSRGVPHAMAVLRAGQETVPYAKERTGFLKNAIDEYGIDNGTTLNQFGVGVLGQLATEDSILGTAYAGAYDMPKKLGEYNREIEKMAISQGYGLDRMNLQAELNDWLNGQTFKRNETAADNNVDRAVETYRGKSEIDFDRQKQLLDYQNSIANETLERQIELRKKICAELGIPEVVAKHYILTGQIPSAAAKDDKTMTYLKNHADVLNKQMENLAKQITDPTLDDAGKARLQAQYDSLQADFTKITQAMSVRNGLTNPSDENNDDGEIMQVIAGREFTADWNKDKPIVDDLNDYAYAMGLSNPEYSAFQDPTKRKLFVKRVLMDYGGYSEELANQAVGIDAKPTPVQQNKPSSSQENKQSTETKPKSTPTKNNQSKGVWKNLYTGQTFYGGDPPGGVGWVKIS